MTGLPNRRAIDYCERPDTSALDAPWIAAIERIRAEEAPTICGACGSTTPEIIERHWCSRCKDWHPVACFSKDRSRPPYHISGICKIHDRRRAKDYRARQALLNRRSA